MGRTKANLPAGGGHTLLSRTVATLLEGGADDVVVVVGHDAEAVARTFAASGFPARFVQNAEYDRGQLSSLLAGLSVADRPGTDAALVTLVDVPFVSARTVRTVVDVYRRTGAPVVRPTRGSEHGHPLLVSRALFEELRRADHVQGAKPVIRAHASAAGDVPIDDPGAFTDIDTPEEYEAALAMFQPSDR
jgi:CTP:molybdopterin cytidylyltransferase MocA